MKKLKDLHIVFTQTTWVVNSDFFKLDDIAICSLTDHLNIGPLCDLGSVDDVKKRRIWLEEKMGDSKNTKDEDITTISTITKEIKSYNDIYIWTGYDSSEIISTARVLSHLIKFDKRIFVLDFFNLKNRDQSGKIASPVTLNEIPLAQFEDVAKYFKQLQSTDIDKWEILWKNVQSENSVLRVLDENGAICQKLESYYDEYLLSNCSTEFKSAGKVVALTLVNIGLSIRDSYLFWRLKELTQDKKVNFKGQLNEISNYKVRLHNNI